MTIVIRCYQRSPGSVDERRIRGPKIAASPGNLSTAMARLLPDGTDGREDSQPIAVQSG